MCRAPGRQVGPHQERTASQTEVSAVSASEHTTTHADDQVGRWESFRRFVVNTDARVRESTTLLIICDVLGPAVRVLGGGALATLWVIAMFSLADAFPAEGSTLTLLALAATGAAAILRQAARLGGYIQRKPAELRRQVDRVYRETMMNLQECRPLRSTARQCRFPPPQQRVSWRRTRLQAGCTRSYWCSQDASRTTTPWWNAAAAAASTPRMSRRCSRRSAASDTECSERHHARLCSAVRGERQKRTERRYAASMIHTGATRAVPDGCRRGRSGPSE